MDSSMISKIQKSKRYAQERERVVFTAFKVNFRGDHRNHVVSYERQQGWACDCDFFARRGVCSHTMAMEKILGVMLPPPEA